MIYNAFAKKMKLMFSSEKNVVLHYLPETALSLCCVFRQITRWWHSV